MVQLKSRKTVICPKRSFQESFCIFWQQICGGGCIESAASLVCSTELRDTRWACSFSLRLFSFSIAWWACSFSLRLFNCFNCFYFSLLRDTGWTCSFSLRLFNCMVSLQLALLLLLFTFATQGELEVFHFYFPLFTFTFRLLDWMKLSTFHSTLKKQLFLRNSFLLRCLICLSRDLFWEILRCIFSSECAGWAELFWRGGQSRKSCNSCAFEKTWN